MTDTALTVRHLVLGGPTQAAADLVLIACAQADMPVAYDRQRHTYLTALTTCADCLAVHAAWHTVFVASL